MRKPDDFSELNGATMFVPGSFREKYRPPPETAEEHPAGAEHLEAPAGTCLLFDIRTYHRNHWNRSGAPRAAILGNIVPRWVMPHTNEHEPAYDRFVESGRADETLTPRERRDADNIMRARWGQSHGRDDALPGGLHTGGRSYARHARGQADAAAAKL